MPSIEVACIGLETPHEPPAGLSFAVCWSAKMVSHRLPARFESEFRALSGTLYHLGNPEFSTSTGGAFFASELLSRDCHDAEEAAFLEFAREHLDSVREILAWLLNVSPKGRALFTTDWQFGPEWARRMPELSIEEFWDLHGSRRLLLNSAYPLRVG